MRHIRYTSIFMLTLAIAALIAGCGDDDKDGDGPPNDQQQVTLLCSDEGSAHNMDTDGDGFSPCQGDCNDEDASFYPGAPEPSETDGIDNDCDNFDPIKE